MKTRIALLIGFLFVSTTSQAQDRGVVSAPPPVEPSYLFTMPTGQVVRSMDMDISASGVLFGEQTVSGLGRAALGLGDIAEMEIGTMDLSSNLHSNNSLMNLTAGGLKVYLPLWQYAHGISASFRRSATYDTQVGDIHYEGKVGEFYSVVSLANYRMGQEDGNGWSGIKLKGHIGAKYTDASMNGVQEIKNSVWRPVLGFEVWRKNERARIVAEMGWSTNFLADGNINDIRIIIGGVRYFFSKHVTFDIGVRHQDNYGGLAESMIQTRLHFAIPTHTLRDRIIGL